MRRVRYRVACSLDGYIAGPEGEADWIVGDRDIDFAGLIAEFDTLLVGRRTCDAMKGRSPGTWGLEEVVASRTLRPEEHPDVRVTVRARPTCER